MRLKDGWPLAVLPLATLSSRVTGLDWSEAARLGLAITIVMVPLMVVNHRLVHTDQRARRGAAGGTIVAGVSLASAPDPLVMALIMTVVLSAALVLLELLRRGKQANTRFEATRAAP